MIKHLKYNNEARQSLASGVDKVADAVSCTMGAAGRNVIIQRKIQQPLVTNDGVTIVRNITLENRFENLGAQLLRESTFQTNYSVGDGSTACVLLAQKLIRQGLERISAGAVPSFLQQGIDVACDAVCVFLKDMALPVSSSEEITRVAAISAGDERIGKMVSEAIDRVGPGGVVMVEKGHLDYSTVEYSEGMRIDAGFYPGDLPQLNTEEQATREELILREPLILCVNSKFKEIEDLIPVLTEAMRINRPLLLFAEDFKEKAIGDLMRVSAQETGFFVVPIKAPGYGTMKKGAMEDISVLTGGKLVDVASGIRIREAGSDCFGTAKRVVLTAKRTVIIDGSGSENAIREHIEALRTQRSQTEDDYLKERLQERIDELSGHNAIIYAGAATEMEMKNLKLRIDNAVNAAYAAIEEGLLPGGGVALLRAREALERKIADADELLRPGMSVVRDSLDAPLRQILSNAGFNASSIEAKILLSEDPAWGFNVVSERFSNMMEIGLFDTVKAIREALKNAAYVASTVLTTGCVIGLDPAYIKHDPRKELHPDDYMDI